MQPVIIFVILSIVVAASFAVGNHAPLAQLEAMLSDVRTSRLARSDVVDPRVVIVAVKSDMSDLFDWPSPLPQNAPTVGEALFGLADSGSSYGWCAIR